MELDIAELEQILLRDRELDTGRYRKVAAHFRSRIRTEKMKLEENQGMINYMDLVRDALDYRKWFEFHMFFKKGEEQKKRSQMRLLTVSAVGKRRWPCMFRFLQPPMHSTKSKKKRITPRIIALMRPSQVLMIRISEVCLSWFTN